MACCKVISERMRMKVDPSHVAIPPRAEGTKARQLVVVPQGTNLPAVHEAFRVLGAKLDIDRDLLLHPMVHDRPTTRSRAVWACGGTDPDADLAHLSVLEAKERRIQVMDLHERLMQLLGGYVRNFEFPRSEPDTICGGTRFRCGTLVPLVQVMSDHRVSVRPMTVKGRIITGRVRRVTA
jgi:hypothetical protein